MKKTDEEHPFNKRMKLESEQEQEISNQKENSMGLSNRQTDSKANQHKNEEEKYNAQAGNKRDPSMSFKMSIGDLNYIQGKNTLILASCPIHALYNFI